MTLFRHLTWLVVFFSFLIQLGSAGLFIWHSKTTISQNNDNQAHNTAEFIANAVISTPEDSLDLNALIDPLITTGQYKEIIALQNQSVLYSQELPLIINAVPDWFQKRFGFNQGPAQVVKLLNGSEILVVVQMNQVKSTYSLYRTIINAIQWVMLGLIITCLALYYALKSLLKPLVDLEDHAIAISNHQFAHKINVPHTRELRQVVLAMNNMSQKLHTLFNEQLEIIKISRRQAYEDPLTRLPNAIAFENYIKLMSADNENKKIGFIVMSKLAGLEDENKHSNRQQTDNSIKHFANIWRVAWQDLKRDTYCARRNSSEFLACVETDSYSTIQQSIQAIHTQYSQLQAQGAFSPRLSLHMSLHYFDSERGYTRWTAICNTLEQNIQFAMDNHRISVGPDYNFVPQIQDKAELLTTMTPTEWNSFFTQTIAEKNIVLEFQPMAYFQDTSYSMAECLMRIPYEDRLLSGSEIWPMINQLQLTYAFDRLIIQMALSHLNENPKQQLSINICDATLANPQFPQWLATTLNYYPDLVDCLSIEIRESFLSMQNAVQILVDIKSIGVALILDRVIAQQKTIDQFVRLPIDAIKMNIHFLRRSYTVGSNVSNSNDESLDAKPCQTPSEHHQQIFLTNLIALCRTCDVAIVADGVESEEDAALAFQLKTAAIQGYWVSPPLISCGACLEWTEESNAMDFAKKA